MYFIDYKVKYISRLSVIEFFANLDELEYSLEPLISRNIIGYFV